MNTSNLLHVQQPARLALKLSSTSFGAVFGAVLAAVISLAPIMPVHAGITDISQAPLVTSATSSVLPNVMFILDDSGSMEFDYMPDIVNDNYCKRITGTYDFTCCGSSTSSTGTGGAPCLINNLTDAAPFTNRPQPLFLVGEFNGVAYNPAITYTPPLNADGTSRNSMTSANTSGWTSVKNDAYGIQNTQSTNLLADYPDLAWCTSTSYTECLRNDNYILPGTVNGKTYTTFYATKASGSGNVATGSPFAPTTAARNFGPHYYTIVPGDYCDAANLRNCQSTPTATFSYPAYFRWCKTTAATTAATANPTASGPLCQATKTPTFQYIRYPTKFFTPGVAAVPAVVGQPYIAPAPAVKAQATFTVALSGTCDGSNKVEVTAVTVNGTNILTGTTSKDFIASNVANSIRGNVSPSKGYTATASGASVTLYGADTAGNITHSVGISYNRIDKKKCFLSITPSTPKFSGGSLAVAGQPYIASSPEIPAIPAQYYGSFIRTDIVPSTTSYPYPGSTTKASTRTDCAGTTCTYAEEMTNFANWWTYYHTRMQMMKSSASISFGTIDQRYRVGYISINNATGSDFLNVSTYDSTQKSAWYKKLFAAKTSGSTPLRAALTKAGRYYGGRLNSSTVNGSTAVDPMQYSCQQNFTILSTDGYWNEGSPGGYQLNGSTAIGDQDSTLSRPQLDGNATADTLSDVAAYYYKTDLRDTGYCTGAIVPPALSGNDVCPNNVPVSGLDAAAHQHMTTFTVGLGASGYMQYSANYETATSGDYFDVRNGTVTSAANGICSWQSSGSCNWPIPASNGPTTIDDLWHTAVNGYGTYFSATNPAVLSSGLTSALAGVSARTGASAAATTSNPNVSTGDNFLFSSTFTSVNWDGEVSRNQINVDTGVISSTPDWSAKNLLDNNTSRVIYTYDPAGTNRLKLFTWANMNTAERAFFNKPNISGLTQLCATGVTCLAAAQQTDAQGEKLLNFLRGERTYEGPAADPSTYYRQRDHVLGDIVNSEAVYVKTPQNNYSDAGYASYKSSISSRQGVVYVGANDGMLHAFNSDTGVEMWAYVPSLVLPELYRTADKNYANLHRYSVDGTVVQTDIYDGSAWRTILVGGLNGGGRGYYALDVTDPTTPKALWEFTYDTTKSTGYTTDANLGYSFGKAEITKLKDGTWVVLVTSGYNNVSPGNGLGYLYVLNAVTGAKISTISTFIGSTTTPSGLGQVRAWADEADVNNLALRAYAGDMLGNVWRFDIDDNLLPAGKEAQLLATLTGSAGNIQPITSKPELGEVLTKANKIRVPMVFVGTGRYIGVTDLSDTSPQSIYGIKDNLGTTSYGNPRSSSDFIKQTITATTCPAGTSTSICTTGQAVRTSTNMTVDLETKFGWYVDLLDSGERANTDPQLALGTLTVSTNVPNASACNIGGYSHLYFFDYATGGSVSSSTTSVSGISLGNALSTRPVVVKLPNNKVISITQPSSGTPIAKTLPTGYQINPTRRVSWRELVTE